MLQQIRAILETVETTGMPAQLRHPCAPRAGVLELDAAALRVLAAYYSTPKRPAETLDDYRDRTSGGDDRCGSLSE